VIVSILDHQTNFFNVMSLATGAIVLFEAGVFIFSPTFIVSRNNASMYLVTTFAGCLIAEHA